MPGAALAENAHEGAPELHWIVPVVQALPVEHDVPAEHALQVPLPLHTPPGHGVPGATLPLATHVGAPLPHAIAPVVHGLPVGHEVPAAHGLQTSLPLQTPPGHEVPAGALPLTVQTAAPVEHASEPAVHGSPVLHEAPAAQGTHVPAPLHTPSGHEVPAGTSPTTLHTDAPVEQSMLAVVHGLLVVHDAPAVQALHVPLPSQTPVGHATPAGKWLVTAHTGAPLVHSMCPLSHELGGVHAAPATQGTQPPAPSHTPPAHVVPAGSLPVALHITTPSGPHAEVPVRHSSLGSHALPATQPQWPLASQVPPEQTVPGGLSAPATHVATPCSQIVLPSRHASAGVQDAPGVQTTQWPAPSQLPSVHAAPAGAGPVVVQAGAPEAQSVTLMVQGSPVLHGAPGTHVLPPSPGVAASAAASAPASPRAASRGPVSIAPTSASGRASVWPASTAEPPVELAHPGAAAARPASAKAGRGRRRAARRARLGCDMEVRSTTRRARTLARAIHPRRAPRARG